MQGQPRRQVPALEELHDHEGSAGLEDTHVEHPRDMLARDAHGGARLPLEARHVLGALEHVRKQKLDGHTCLQAKVPRRDHGAHAAYAEDLLDGVFACDDVPFTHPSDRRLPRSVLRVRGFRALILSHRRMDESGRRRPRVKVGARGRPCARQASDIPRASRGLLLAQRPHVVLQRAHLALQSLGAGMRQAVDRTGGPVRRYCVVVHPCPRSLRALRGRGRRLREQAPGFPAWRLRRARRRSAPGDRARRCLP